MTYETSGTRKKRKFVFRSVSSHSLGRFKTQPRSRTRARQAAAVDSQPKTVTMVTHTRPPPTSLRAPSEWDSLVEGHSTGAAGREWWLVITPGQREQRLEGEAEAPLHLVRVRVRVRVRVSVRVS